jgi:hypothetical protein
MGAGMNLFNLISTQAEFIICFIFIMLALITARGKN